MATVTTRQICQDFVAYLKRNESFKNVWERSLLSEEYKVFKDNRADIKVCFSSFLYKAFRLKPSVLIKRKGDIIFTNVSPMPSAPPANALTNANRRRRNRRRQGRRRNATELNSSTKVSFDESTPLGAHFDTSLDSSSVLFKGVENIGIFPCKAANPVRRIPYVADSFRRVPLADVSSDTIRPSRNRCPANSWDINSTSVEASFKQAGPFVKPARTLTTANAAAARARNSKVPIPACQEQDKENSRKFQGKVHRNLQENTAAANDTSREVIAGVRPKFLAGGKKAVLPLPHFKIPPEVEIKYQYGHLKNDPLLFQNLSCENYIQKFDLLLYVEEIQYRSEIQSYTMGSTTLQKIQGGKNLLYLDVPGLAENRPSLLIGDRVYAIRLDAKGKQYGCEYEGYVHCVEQLKVGLGFHSKFVGLFQKNMKFTIRFTFNRRPLRLMHRALELVSLTRLREMLFPTRFPESYTPKMQLIMKKREIESNLEQRTAVQNIVLGKTPPIYIIFGPPGTGKTVTMVEAIYQTHRIFNYNILVCALCNNACDMLASKLQKYVDKSKMIRIYAASRSWKSVPDDIKRGNTNFNGGELYMPEEGQLTKYKIIICTFVTAGRIASMGFPNGHFQRIFIDESGQAFEPECLVAVSGILASEGKLILAGDPKQLGPIVRSPLAIRHGLQMSLLQRLMDTCLLYQKDRRTGQYNQQCVTKLVRNYRSHEVILKISNEHFYDGDLKVCANELARTKMCRWDGLPNKHFPIIFHGVEGNQTRDKSSPSYYNPEEVKVVKGYVDQLMYARGTHKLGKAGDIGIVTPYRKQCEKIRNVVQKYQGIDVGSVEVFQGQERPVIIISTVRSSKVGLTDDAKYHLGFLCDPKRFNVALTRAQALLIIVGNPRMLSLDKYWKSLLKYCMENNAYRGKKFTTQDFHGASDMDEIERLFGRLDLATTDTCDNDDDLATPFWRTEH